MCANGVTSIIWNTKTYPESAGLANFEFVDDGIDATTEPYLVWAPIPAALGGSKDSETCGFIV